MRPLRERASCEGLRSALFRLESINTQETHRTEAQVSYGSARSVGIELLVPELGCRITLRASPRTDQP